MEKREEQLAQEISELRHICGTDEEEGQEAADDEDDFTGDEISKEAEGLSADDEEMGPFPPERRTQEVPSQAEARAEGSKYAFPRWRQQDDVDYPCTWPSTGTVAQPTPLGPSQQITALRNRFDALRKSRSLVPGVPSSSSEEEVDARRGRGRRSRSERREAREEEEDAVAGAEVAARATEQATLAAGLAEAALLAASG